jgi:hypothetical protein
VLTGLQDFFHRQHVLPPIPEVIRVFQPGLHGQTKLLERHRALIDHPLLVKLGLWNTKPFFAPMKIV